MSDRYFQEIRSQVKEKAYAAIAWPFAKSRFDEAAGLFLDFCALEQRVKERYAGFVDEDHRRGEIGYRQKSRGDGHGDTKEFFHYNQFFAERFKELVKRGPEEVRLFDEAAWELYADTLRAVEPLYQALDSAVPGIKDRFLPPGGRPRFFQRYLAYRPVEDKEVLALPHLDKGPFTLALEESTDGLRLGKDEASLRPVQRADDEVVFFMGGDAHSVLPPHLHEDFPFGLHDVVQTGEPTGEDLPRWAIVLFMDPSDRLYDADMLSSHPLGRDPKKR